MYEAETKIRWVAIVAELSIKQSLPLYSILSHLHHIKSDILDVVALDRAGTESRISLHQSQRSASGDNVLREELRSILFSTYIGQHIYRMMINEDNKEVTSSTIRVDVPVWARFTGYTWQWPQGSIKSTELCWAAGEASVLYLPGETRGQRDAHRGAGVHCMAAELTNNYEVKIMKSSIWWKKFKVSRQPSKTHIFFVTLRHNNIIID